jgi:hypothetical protein
MPAKPFRIVETPPDLPSAEKLARSYRLSPREAATITKFAASVRERRRTHKSVVVARFDSRKRVAARKKR